VRERGWLALKGKIYQGEENERDMKQISDKIFK
jgi:hypothetical protein